MVLDLMGEYFKAGSLSRMFWLSEVRCISA